MKSPCFAEFLDSPEAIAEYLNAVFEDGDPDLIVKATGNVARRLGMKDVAEEAGLSRENLYRSLSGKTNPEFATIMKVLHAIGVQLKATPREK